MKSPLLAVKTKTIKDLNNLSFLLQKFSLKKSSNSPNLHFFSFFSFSFFLTLKNKIKITKNIPIKIPNFLGLLKKNNQIFIFQFLKKKKIKFFFKMNCQKWNEKKLRKIFEPIKINRNQKEKKFFVKFNWTKNTFFE